MPTLKVSARQALSLIEQLSVEGKHRVLERLVFEIDTNFTSACKTGEKTFKKSLPGQKPES